MRRTLFISNIGWDFVWQRHQTLASLFAQEGEVIFCEIPGMRRVRWRDVPRLLGRLRLLAGGKARRTEPPPAGVRLVRPMVLPATNAAFCAFNRRVLARLVRTDAFRGGFDLVVNYSPSRSARQLLAAVPHRRMIYDCTDDWLAVRGIPAFLPEDERALLAGADLTLVPSRRLESLKRPFARRLVRLPHGAFVDRFLVGPKAPGAPGALNVLYYGHLHGQHVDFHALDLMATRRPMWRFVLVGPVKTPHAFPPNVLLPGQQPHRALRQWIEAADVLILPYALNDYTRSVMPAKTYECLATGRPIVATPLPELKADFAEYMRFAATPDAWVGAVEAALREDTPAAQAARVSLAKANSWADRYGEIRRLID
jgi:hypothetical protein